jgi:heterodisulfide reductase subunit A
MPDDKGKKVPAKPQPSALVLGAGVAGIRAALDLANSGIFVHLVEDKPFIGGVLPQLDKQFPNDSCGMCRMLSVFGNEFCSEFCLKRSFEHPNINIITNGHLMSLDGEAGNFEAFVIERARCVDIHKCIACDKCVDVCPVEVDNEFNSKLDKRKAIFTAFPNATPSTYAVDAQNCTECSECVKVCPTEAIDLKSPNKEDHLNVNAVILATGFAPFDPSSMGSYHYSEYADVLTALEFERLISGTGPAGGRELRRISDGEMPENIAFIQCIGSRDQEHDYCSSACCMHSLKEAMMVKELHPEIKVTIFFMDMRAFGKGYHRYYEEAMDGGIRFVRSRAPGIRKTEDEKLLINYVNEKDESYTETFDIVVLATGQKTPDKSGEVAEVLGIDINEHGFFTPKNGLQCMTTKPGVFACGSCSGPKDIPDSVAEASCAAAQARSLMVVGPHEDLQEKETSPSTGTLEHEEKIAVILCRCGEEIAGKLDMNELKAHAEKLPDTKLVCAMDYPCIESESITEKLSEAEVDKVVFAACTPYAYDVKFKKAAAAAGIDASEIEIANIREGCTWVHKDSKKAAEKAQALIAMAHTKLREQDSHTLEVVGVTDRALVIGGGVSGMTGALRIAQNGHSVDVVERDEELGGQARHLHYTVDGMEVQPLLKGIIEKVEKNPAITLNNSSEVIRITGTVGHFKADIMTPKNNITEQYGTVIIATGAGELIPEEYLFGKNKSVITQRELEERIVKGTLKAQSIVMIQCTGLRDEKRHYCSRICCSQSIKNALKIKESNPEAQIHILYRDIMTYGFTEKYYIKAKEEGIDFIRFEEEGKPKIAAGSSGVDVKIIDPVLDEVVTLHADIVALSQGLVPDNSMISNIFDFQLPRDEDGFLCEADVKFRPVDVLDEGIFVCGSAHSPKNLTESLVSAQAAAGRALTVLSRGELKAKGAISEVNERWCVGCEACIVACPYHARNLAKDRKVAQVVDAICQGCGVCAVMCPSGAAKLKEYKDRQIMAMIDEAVV